MKFVELVKAIQSRDVNNVMLELAVQEANFAEQGFALGNYSGCVTSSFNTVMTLVKYVYKKNNAIK